MSDEPPRRTSRAGAAFVALAIAGSAIGVAAWHHSSNRGGNLDTSGFDMSSSPETARSAPGEPSPAPSAAPTSLGMVRSDADMRSSSATPDRRPNAAAGRSSFRGVAIKNEKIVGNYVRRMEAKYPSLTQYGKDWAASPELRALRDQYWKERNPIKFARGIAKSKDFAALMRKYSTDQGIRAFLTQGLKEAPPDLMSAAGDALRSDASVKNLVDAVMQATGLPPSLTAALSGGGSKPPDQNRIMSEMLSSPEIKKALQKAGR